MTIEENTFFSLLRLGLWGKYEDVPKLNNEQWNDVLDLSNKQSLLGIIADAIELLPADKRPPAGKRVLHR